MLHSVAQWVQYLLDYKICLIPLPRDDSFKDHIKFLHSQGIAGISHHSLLFSKTAALSVANDDWVVQR